MTSFYRQIGVACLLSALHLPCLAEEKPTLNLEQAIGKALSIKSKADPFTIFDLRKRLPEACLRPEIETVVRELARTELEHQRTIEVASLFFRIQAMENRLLAAGETVAATFVDWQRLKSKPEAGPESQQAETSYLRALASREDLRVSLRREYHLLASAIGEPGALSVELVADERNGNGISSSENKQPPRAKQIALEILSNWWQRAAKTLFAASQTCTKAIAQVSAEEKTASDRQDDLARTQIDFLRRYAIPAAESELQLAELRLDQARGKEPGAPRLGQAMTDSLLAVGALQATQNKLYLEQLRLKRSAGLVKPD